MKKIANITLALAILIATTGVTLSKHYCLGRLKSVAINEHASHCYEGEEEKMPCCEDVEEELKVEEVTTASFDVNFNPDLYEIAIITFILSKKKFVGAPLPYFSYKDPPIPDRNLQALHQSFLI